MGALCERSSINSCKGPLISTCTRIADTSKALQQRIADSERERKDLKDVRKLAKERARKAKNP